MNPDVKHPLLPVEGISVVLEACIFVAYMLFQLIKGINFNSASSILKCLFFDSVFA